MNVALVVLDTLRKDAFDRQFSWLDGRRYESAWTPARWTVPAHKALFTGRYPREVGGDETKPLAADQPVLAERLAEAGYTTRAFSANPNISWPYGYDRGFDEFWGSWRLDPFRPESNVLDWGRFIREHETAGPEKYLRAIRECVVGDVDTVASLREGVRLKLEDLGYRFGPDDDGARTALERLRETSFGDREFLFVNLMEAHEPYLPPKRFRTTDYSSGSYIRWTVEGSDSTDGSVERAYRDSVDYLAWIYEQIHDVLRAEFDLIVTLSDHGELFGEHGAWGHCHGVYPELVNVPLVFSGDAVGDAVVDRPVSLLDIHETVCVAAGVSSGDLSRGRDLLAETVEESSILIEDFGVSPERIDGLRESGIDEATLEPYLGPFRGVVAEGSYGYETPGGFEALGDADPAVLREHLSALNEEIPAVEGGEEGTELSAEMRDQLADLGYL